MGKESEILEEDKKYCSMCDNPWHYYHSPPVFKRGKGSYVYDVNNKKYLDFIGGCSSINFGHCNSALSEKVKYFVENLTQLYDAITPARPKLAKMLVRESGLKGKAYFDVGGTSVVEASLKFARAYTGRKNFISFFGAFHGRSLGALSLTAGYHYKIPIQPTAFEPVRVPYPYCYRCFYSKEYPDCGMYCTQLIERLFESSLYGVYDPSSKETNIAAIVVEPAQGGGGYIFPPKEFFRELRKICDEYNILFVDDEVQMGFGRTGKMFCYQHYGVKPDITTLAKSLGGGFWPLSAVIGRKDIMDSVNGIINSTFASSPLGLAIGLETVKYIKKERLCQKTERKGKYFLKMLMELTENKKVGMVEGKGLAIGIEIVKDKKTKKPDPRETIRITNRALKKGLLLQRGGYFKNRFNIAPPLTITREEIDEGYQLLKESIK